MQSFAHLFEEIVSVLLEGEVGGAAVVVEAVVHILELQHLSDLERQILKGNGETAIFIAAWKFLHLSISIYDVCKQKLNFWTTFCEKKILSEKLWMFPR